jgi:hypothetical protein
VYHESRVPSALALDLTADPMRGIVQVCHRDVRQGGHLRT